MKQADNTVNRIITIEMFAFVVMFWDYLGKVSSGKEI